jgi:streptomycin 6-kinase
MASPLDPLHAHIESWGLTPDGDPFETPSSWLCFVTRGNEHAVLKAFKPDSDEAPSARYLTLHKGRGTVRVLDSDDRAILLERIAPGTMLRTLPLEGRDDDATHIVCDTIEKLQSAKADPAGWPGHDLQFSVVGTGYAIPPLSEDIAARAAAMFRDLEASQPARVLLHGDLHHDNILFDTTRGWLAIDPKGEVGELAYELAAPLRNPLERVTEFVTPAHMDRRVQIYRVLGWCFARNCSAALWHANRTPESERGKVWAAATLAALDLLGC